MLVQINSNVKENDEWLQLEAQNKVSTMHPRILHCVLCFGHIKNNPRIGQIFGRNFEAKFASFF